MCGDVGENRSCYSGHAFDGVGWLSSGSVGSDHGLAEQHGSTFRERPKQKVFGLRSLNRFRKPAETKAIVEQVREGKVDVLIGTHRILSQDIVFDRLSIGVDEEHRFGVDTKSGLKSLNTK